MIVYNEIDPFAAAWLRELVKANMIAPGEVWENDIRDIRPADLRGVIQFHGFAGIGVWSYAARRAGWPDDRPLWTMSCPCQPFSAAGAGAGFADERHLWPHAHYLIRECRPPVVAGEQVASKDADAWIDLVQDDMEAMDYVFGAFPFPSASVGAPHIRDRDYWMAYSERVGRIGRGPSSESGRKAFEPVVGPRDAGRLADADHEGLEGRRKSECERGDQLVARPHGQPVGRSQLVEGEPHTGPTNGFWRDADWLFCRDGKWRPVEPGTFPLAHGAAARVGRLRGYGNAVNAVQAQIFIEAVKEIVDG